MQYLEYHFITSDEQTAEILMALLAEAGFDTFDQNEHELSAYIQESVDDIERIAAYLDELQQRFVFTWSQKQFEKKNWNAEWEKSFQPVCIANRCLIRAPFHPAQPGIEFDILIEPRMSFGTGHHESTNLIMEEMLGFNLQNKEVCDAGCGTGILAILAYKKGAKHVLGIDNEEWAYQNALDNIALNGIYSGVSVELGDFSLMEGRNFDVILANINKHIVLGNIARFFSSIQPGGYLIVSGILENDIQDVEKEAANYFFQLISTRTKNDWLCAVFQNI